MANVHRLIYLLILVLPSLARADYTATYNAETYGCQHYSGTWRSSNQPTAAAACTAAAVADGATTGTISGSQCNFTYSNGSTLTSMCAPLVDHAAYYSCPTGGTLSGSTCLQEPCQTGWTRDSSGTCINPCASATGTVTGLYSIASNNPKTLSYNGCQYTVTSGNTCSWVGSNEACWYTGVAVGTGQPATTETLASTPTQQTQTCPVGQCTGTFNGTSMCLPCSSTTSNASSAGTTTTITGGGSSVPGGSTTTIQVSTTYNSTTQTISTTTTTTTVTNNNGTPSTTTGTTTSDQPLSTFCQTNPTSPYCTASTATSSDCTAEPACSGDPVGCAALVQTWKMQCALTANDTDTTQAVTDAISHEDDTAAVASALTPTTIDASTGLSHNAWLGAGTCPSDMTINMPIGTALTIPFSDLCGILQAMGAALLAVSGLISYRTMQGAFS